MSSHADARHHVLGDELPLAGVVVQLVQDLLERCVIAESAAGDGGGRDGTIRQISL